jgi:deoxycytidylate deaminase
MNRILHSLPNVLLENPKGVPHQGFKHYSGIFHKGKLAQRGSNHLRNCYSGKCSCYSTHAEIDAVYRLLKSKPKLDLSNYVVVVIRISRDGTIHNSRPCNQCLDLLVEYGIRRVVWSLDNGTFVWDNPYSMERLHESSGWAAFLNPTRLK